MFNLQVTSTTMELLPLVCLCLLTRSGTTFAEEGSNVIRVDQGSDATLTCSLSSMEDIELKLFDWKKDGQKEVFLYDGGLHYNNGRTGQDQQFDGRVSHFPDKLKHGDASIKIRNTKVNDSGDYTCAFPRLEPSQIFHTRLVVGRILKDRSGENIPGSKVINVEEDSDVTLPCSLSTKEDIEFKLFVWKKDGQKEVFLYDAGFHSNNGRDGQDEQFKGRVSHFPDQLTHGNASIIIRNTKVTDSGDYTCAFPLLQPSQTFHIRLVVVGRILKDRSGENIPGAAATPSVTILDQTNNWVLLQCEVRDAFPKPKVEWQDRAGNILPAEEPQVSERGGSYDIILNTTVTKTDRYRCVATQEDIYHQTNATIDVHIREPKVIYEKEGSNVTLPCSLSSKENITDKVFDWKKDGQKEVLLYDAVDHYKNGRDAQDQQFKGRVSHFPDKLKHGNASIKIMNTKLTDSGDYTCEFPLLQPRQIFYIRLIVVGAVPKPHIMKFEANDRALLLCVVQGSPKPKVEWQDRAGNILPAEETQVSERGGRFYIILQTTVTKTDHYRCVATQEEIRHQTNATIDVHISGRILTDGSGTSTGWVVAAVLAVLLVAAAVVFLSWFYSRRRSTQNAQRGSHNLQDFDDNDVGM